MVARCRLSRLRPVVVRIALAGARPLVVRIALAGARPLVEQEAVLMEWPSAELPSGPDSRTSGSLERVRS